MKNLKSTVTENSNQISDKERFKPPNLLLTQKRKGLNPLYFTIAFLTTFSLLLSTAEAQK